MVSFLELQYTVRVSTTWLEDHEATAKASGKRVPT